MRFIAALLVVAYHADLQLVRIFGPDAQRAHFGASGVDLFFVISGFIMVYTTEPRPPAFAEFMKRRIIRIVPLYWLFTTIMLGVALLAPKLLHSTALDAWHIAASYLMVPYQHPVTGNLRPLLVPGWTLNAEMFFYVLFGALLFLPLTRRVAGIFFVLAFLVALSWVTDLKGGGLTFYGAPLMLEFAAGCGVGWLVVRRWRASAPVLFILAALAVLVAGWGIAIGLSEQPSRVFFWGVPSALVLYVSLAIERVHGWPEVQLLRLGGDASYSLYLSHLFVLGAFGSMAARSGVGAYVGPESLRLAMLLVAAVTGIAIFKWIETPLLNALRRWQDAGRPAAAVPMVATGPHGRT